MSTGFTTRGRIGRKEYLTFGLILLFTESAKGANQYGPEPTAA